MPSVNEFNVLALVIELSVAVSAALALALVVVLLFIRGRNGRARKRQAEVTARWREVFKIAYTGESEFASLPPPVDARDWFTVLQIFVQFHDIREHDRNRADDIFPKLDSVARRIGMPEHALSILQRGDDAEKILALNVLGHLRETRSYALAIDLSESPGAELSRAAAHCALRVDPDSLGAVLELVKRRSDWVRSRVEVMLREIGPDRLTQAMPDALALADDAETARLLDYVRFCTPAGARRICRDVLATAVHHETIAAALRSLAPLAGDEDHATAVRYCRYREPIVAISALRVLRKCVQHEDRTLLTGLLESRDYWVRLRSAEVVVELYGDTGLAQQMMEQHPDRFARDAIRQAIAERRMMALRKPRPDRRGAGAAKPLETGTATA